MKKASSPRLGLAGIPNAAESIMLERDLRLVALTGGRYHAASLTTMESDPQTRPRRRLTSAPPPDRHVAEQRHHFTARF